MGEWNEEDHPRDSYGKFTIGEAGEHASTSGARTATARAVASGKKIDTQKPEAKAGPDAHAAHAASLRGVALQHANAAKAHTLASKRASDAGEKVLAKEHANAALQHSKEAKERTGEAREHSALAHVDRAAQESANKAVGKEVHETSKDAARASEKATAKGESGKDHEKPGAREEHKEGMAAWVKDKMGEATEAIHEKGEQARELQEKALEGNLADLPRALQDAAAGGIGGLGKRAAGQGGGEHGEAHE